MSSETDGVKLLVDDQSRASNKKKRNDQNRQLCPKSFRLRRPKSHTVVFHLDEVMMPQNRSSVSLASVLMEFFSSLTFKHKLDTHHSVKYLVKMFRPG